MEFQNFLNFFTEILSKHAPLKKEFLGASLGNFVIGGLQWLTGYLGMTLVFVWSSA